MVYQGTVQNGVVVFPSGVHLPGDSPVRVELESQSAPETSGLPERTLFDVLTERGILGCYDGPIDLTTNPKHMKGSGESRRSKILIDTGPPVALFDRRDAYVETCCGQTPLYPEARR